ncbi:hypothetical protein [Leeuwenhoekiella parthenopeia]|uniref:Uncharacterized protein n=1 Tax=Leeuwenhoekiella parthenopeia TaxID=2890320 RepID=A0ABS8GT76_9FLAO|nr:hypothetical protein [Leeuwenhoekiella parthenopeia]MCC4212845.1 hypothetical protein [Leeuwenhoekiella parthenopeia]
MGVSDWQLGFGKKDFKKWSKAVAGLDNRSIFAPQKSGIKNGFTFIKRLQKINLKKVC